MKISHKLFIGIALAIALGVIAWVTWAYQNSQNEIEALQQEVKLLTQKKIVTTPLSGAAFVADAGTSETVTPQTTPMSALQGPQLTAEPKTLDLGTVRKADGPRTGTFNLKNTGNGDLLLRTILSSCGCTTVEVKNVTVAPGASHKLPVTYDPNYFGPKLELGPVEKWIAILSNDPENPVFKVFLKANVVP